MSSTLSGFAPDRLSARRPAHPAASSLAPTLRVPLGDVGAWHESLLIQPVAHPRGAVSVRIESLLDTARVPTDVQVRYRATLDRDALLRLREAIDAALGSLSATDPGVDARAAS